MKSGIFILALFFQLSLVFWVHNEVLIVGTFLVILISGIFIKIYYRKTRQSASDFGWGMLYGSITAFFVMLAFVAYLSSININ